MAYNPKDYFFKKAKQENYVARSVFKIQEIDERFHLFKSGYKVLDLGAAPGSWSQYACQKIGAQGKVLGIDIQPIKLSIANAVFITADMRALNLEEVMAANGVVPPFDVVLSDMAPKTIGVRITDQMRSLELCELAARQLRLQAFSQRRVRRIQRSASRTLRTGRSPAPQEHA
jgi:23S rRNA (uridine2552-2'-O)-methyltransferase